VEVLEIASTWEGWVPPAGAGVGAGEVSLCEDEDAARAALGVRQVSANGGGDVGGRNGRRIVAGGWRAVPAQV